MSAFFMLLGKSGGGFEISLCAKPEEKGNFHG